MRAHEKTRRRQKVPITDQHLPAAGESLSYEKNLTMLELFPEPQIRGYFGAAIWAGERF